MVIGPTYGGKTTVMQMLRDSHTLLRKQEHENEEYQNVTMKRLNPKAITMGELYGNMDFETGEWTNGLASDIFDQFVKETDKNIKKWICFDGPVDALWIENLNTVLDDNMTLCLSNGQRMKLNLSMRVLFEAQDLDEASPATVSRCGIIYLDQRVISNHNMFKSQMINEIGDELMAPE
jgi:dynein heavy chain